jgi:glycosyl transferase family 25
MRSKEDTLFVNIILILIITMGMAYIIHTLIPKVKERFEALVPPEPEGPKPMPFPIDAVIYINLDSRPDRKEELTAEMSRIGIPSDKIFRLSAVKRKWGALGCSLSHIACMNFIIERGWQRTLVLEDDAGFEDKNKERWNAGLKDVNSLIGSGSLTNLDAKWDVVFLGGFVRDTGGPIKTEYNSIWRTKNTSCTHAYIVRGEYAKKILLHTEMAVQMMMKNPANVKQYNLDNAWSGLMAEDRWYITIPTLAYQRESFSDIEGQNANADEPLRGEVVRAWKAGTVLT